MRKVNLVIGLFVSVFFVSCNTKSENQSKLNLEMNHKLEMLGQMKEETLIELNNAKKKDSLNNGSSDEIKMEIMSLETKIKVIDDKYNNILERKE